MNYLVGGKEPTRFGNASTDTVPTAAFETADRPIFVCCANDRTWNRLAGRVLDRPDLADNPVYATTSGRIQHRDEILAIVGRILSTHNRAHWLGRMREAGVPGGAIASVAEAFGSQVMADRQMLSEIPHPTEGMVPNIRLPFRMAGTPLADPVAAPLLGQHSEAVLRDVLGYDDAAVEGLRASGAVKLG